MDVFLAGPMFTRHERAGISELAGRLRRAGLSVFVPHEAIPADTAPGPKTPPSAVEVYRVDTQGLRSARVMLAVLDGSAVDDGTACEIGHFQQLAEADPSKLGVIGLLTDDRRVVSLSQGQFEYALNLYIQGCVEHRGRLTFTPEEAVGAVRDLIARGRAR